jgi:hypothetical protein
MPDINLPQLRQRVINVLSAREWFRRTAPSWAPPLPIRVAECEALGNGTDHRLALLGFFGISLAFEGWDYTGHPTFPCYASALLAHPHTPHRLRDDPELKRSFHPKSLRGSVGARANRSRGIG